MRKRTPATVIQFQYYSVASETLNTPVDLLGMPDEVDLANDLQRLSLQQPAFKALNKKPFTPISLEDEFEAFSPFKASFRVLMNYKDMVTYNFKAGTLINLQNLPNVFEVWPSISIKPNSKNCFYWSLLNLFSPWI